MSDPNVLLRAVHDDLAAVEPQIQTIRPKGPDRKRLADAVEAAIGHAALGTKAGRDAAIADLTGAQDVILRFRGDGAFSNAQVVAQAADRALPELRAIVWPVEGLAPAISDPAEADVIQTTAANLAAAYAAAGPGKTILVAPGGTFPGGLTLDRSGTAAQPVVIRVGTLVGGRVVDPPSFPAATIAGEVTFSGDHNWLRGFAVGGFLVDRGTSGSRLNRCELTRQTDDHGVDTWLDWCEWTGVAGVCHQTDPTQGTLRPKVYRCHFHDDVGTVAPNRVFMQFGNNPAALTSLFGWARDCLFGPNSGGVQQAIEMKSCDNQVIRCSAVAQPGTSLRFHTRVGMRNTIQACWVSSGFIGGRGPGHVYADNVVLAGQKAVGPYGGNIAWEDWVARFAAGTVDAGMYPIGKDSRVVRQNQPVIGFTDSGAGHLGPTGTTLEACVLPYALQNNAEVPQVLTSALFPPPPEPALRWPTSKVGPNGVYHPSD